MKNDILNASKEHYYDTSSGEIIISNNSGELIFSGDSFTKYSGEEVSNDNNFIKPYATDKSNPKNFKMTYEIMYESGETSYSSLVNIYML